MGLVDWSAAETWRGRSGRELRVLEVGSLFVECIADFLLRKCGKRSRISVQPAPAISECCLQCGFRLSGGADKRFERVPGANMGLSETDLALRRVSGVEFILLWRAASTLFAASLVAELDHAVAEGPRSAQLQQPAGRGRPKSGLPAPSTTGTTVRWTSSRMPSSANWEATPPPPTIQRVPSPATAASSG